MSCRLVGSAVSELCPAPSSGIVGFDRDSAGSTDVAELIAGAQGTVRHVTRADLTIGLKEQNRGNLHGAVATPKHGRRLAIRDGGSREGRAQVDPQLIAHPALGVCGGYSW